MISPCSTMVLRYLTGRFGIAGGTEPKFQGVALRIHGALEVHPHFFDLSVCLIDAPRVIGRVEMRRASLLQFWSKGLNPAIDRGVIDMQTPLSHHLFEVAVAERIP